MSTIQKLACRPGHTRRQLVAGIRSASKLSAPVELSYSRLSTFWLVSGGFHAPKDEDSHGRLSRAGFLRQSHAGIFHMLPLGLRVQAKLEALIDKHMSQLGASKVSLSSISSSSLWEKTDRLEGYGPELFQFHDRKGVPYLLAPTHEEEITTLVAKTVNSYKALPLRLYQIGRKYRDEMRPRQGILRGREFVMKDLYTFDYSRKLALETYEEARSAYSRLFDELKLPYVVAEASSGGMGGNLSHEYHLPTSAGDDNVVSCDNCNYAANDELASSHITDECNISPRTTLADYSAARAWRGVSKDRKTLVNVWYPSSSASAAGCDPVAYSDVDVNPQSVKGVVPDLDSGNETPFQFWKGGTRERIVNIVDLRLGPSFVLYLKANQDRLLPHANEVDLSQSNQVYMTESADGSLMNTLRVRQGDSCPRCSSGKLDVRKAIELGHTFHLGTRYSEQLLMPLVVPASMVASELGREVEDPAAGVKVPIQMGCHGIGISRIIGALAHHLADSEGLNWPRVVAPFEVVVITNTDSEADGAALSSSLSSGPDSGFDVAHDDRDKPLGWKLKDSDLMGCPVVIVLGGVWKSEKKLDIKCRRLGFRKQVTLEEAPGVISSLLAQL